MLHVICTASGNDLLSRFTFNCDILLIVDDLRVVGNQFRFTKDIDTFRIASKLHKISSIYKIHIFKSLTLNSDEGRENFGLSIVNFQ